MRELRPFGALPLLAGLVILAGCNSGGGGEPQELEVAGLQVCTDNPQLGHTMCVQVEIKAAMAGSDAPLVFMVANRAEVDAGAAQPTLEVVDAKPVAPLLAGDNLYEMHLDLPEDTIAPGQYYLIVVIDPVDTVPESDEENNGLSADEIADRGVLVTLSSATEAVPDIVLESIVVDDPVVGVDVTPEAQAPVEGIADVPNSSFGVTATVMSSGPASLPNVALLAELEIPGLGIFPLQVWDTVSGTYAGTTAIGDLVATEPTAIHLDVLIPQATLDAIAALLPPAVQGVVEADALTIPCKVHVNVDPADAYPEFEGGIVLLGDEDGDDNSEAADVFLYSQEEEDIQGQLAAAAPVNELNWDIPFVKSFSNNNVGVGVRFGATAQVGTNGILGEAGASVPMTIVGFTIDLLSLDAKGLFNPLHKADNGFVVTLKALTIKLYEKRTKEDEALTPGSPLSYHQEQAYAATFTVGPVPMFVKIGAGGTVGLDINASVGSNFQIAAEPYLNFTVFGEGGPGGSYLGWTLGGGVGASMKLIDDRFHAGIMAGVTYDSATSIMTGSITEEVSNDLKGPSGTVYLFVTAEGKILWATIKKRWQYVLTTWSTFEKKDTLFNQTQSVSVTIP